MITPEQIARNGSEHAEQAALFQWLALEAFKYREAGRLDVALKLEAIFAIPNGDQRGDGSHKGAQIAGARLKAEGQRSGVPDVFCASAEPMRRDIPTNCVYHGLFIEMKRKDAYRANDPLAGASKDQKLWIEKLRNRGYAATVCYGWEHARDTLKSYLAIT